MISRSFLLLLLLVAFSFVTACDSGNAPLPIYGEFSVTATSSDGDSITFSGNAFASFNRDTLQTISLFEADDQGQLGTHSVIFSPREPIPLLPGGYTVGGILDSEASYIGFYTIFDGPTSSIESGELTIESVADQEVAGRFTMEATGRLLTSEGPTRYTIRGTFEALITRPPQ